MDKKSVNEILKDKGKYLSEEKLRIVRNKLTQVTLSADRLEAEKREIYKVINEIKELLDDKD